MRNVEPRILYFSSIREGSEAQGTQLGRVRVQADVNHHPSTPLDTEPLCTLLKVPRDPASPHDLTQPKPNTAGGLPD